MAELPSIDSKKSASRMLELWGDSILPTLEEYIRIPNKSPMFDSEWQNNGYMKAAADLIARWCRDHAVEGMKLDLVELPGRTPVLFIEVPGTVDDTVLLYGHFDKQPEMTGWEADLGPWKPVRKGDRLYGRGGADDGYSAFASLAALRMLREQGIPHARAVILIEGCEESGSFDLPYYVDHLAPRIGSPSLVICLDSGAGNYEQLWCTTSLRGTVNGTLRVSLLREGIHSGDASGIVASSFRVARHVLSRLEDPRTGAIVPDALYVEIPRDRIAQAGAVAEALGTQIYDRFPWRSGVVPIVDDGAELILNRTWRPQLAVTGAGGLPALADAGNVMRPETSLKLSIRLPPTLDAKTATRNITRILTADPPYGAHIDFLGSESSNGWNAPMIAPWLGESLSRASKAYFDNDCMYMGEGGTIPFMAMLGAKFPQAQFMITGVLGPESNAHGPNEFLHVPTAQKLSCCTAQILRDHAANSAAILS